MRVTIPVGLTLDLRPDWCDVTDDVAGENVPFTLARPQGSGALQFSAGLHRSGIVPNLSKEDLRAMLLNFAATQRLGEASDVVSESVPLQLVAASFRPDHFLRAWYLSDGRSVALVTLTNDSDPDPQELSDCEYMLRSVQFEPTGDASPTLE